jgi:hypothetical protein
MYLANKLNQYAHTIDVITSFRFTAQSIKKNKDEHVEDAIFDLKHAPGNYDGKGEKGTAGQRGGRWYGQPEYVEAWVEKNDLVPGFLRILKPWDIIIRGNHGYSSFTFLYQCTQDLKDVIERKGMKQSDVTILYSGDQDPSGENIDWYLKRRLAQLGLEGINFERVAVRPEQITKYHLPLLPVEIKEGNEFGDPNMY